MFKDEKGHTFIEILASVTILAVVALPLLTLFLSGMSAASNAGKQTVAVNLCREKIEELKADGYERTYNLYVEEELSPRLEEQVEGYALFSRKTEVWPETVDFMEGDPELQPDFLRIKVTVFWTDMHGRERHAGLQTIRAAR